MTLVQVFRCRDCDYRWGPVGVLPYAPETGSVQLFLHCRSCGRPSVLEVPPGPVERRCSCGALDWAELDRCPGCGGDQAGWEPVP